jgi:hypothetical protein
MQVTVKPSEGACALYESDTTSFAKVNPSQATYLRPR